LGKKGGKQTKRCRGREIENERRQSKNDGVGGWKRGKAIKG